MIKERSLNDEYDKAFIHETNIQQAMNLCLNKDVFAMNLSTIIAYIK